MIESPLVSIIMPVYNPGEEINSAIESIINQTYINWELLIVDDGSKEDLQTNINKLDDPRIRYYKNSENKKLYYRLNQALEMSKGIFIARMDHDDISYPMRLQRQVEFLLENNQVDVVSVRAIAIDKTSNPLGCISYQQFHADIVKRPWKGFNLIHPSWMGRRDWFKIYLYKNNYLCEDQVLLLSAYRDSIFHTIPEILFAYRIKEKFYLKKNCITALSLLKNQLKAFVKYREVRWLCMAILNCSVKIISYSIIKVFLTKSYNVLKYRNELSQRDLEIYYSIIMGSCKKTK